NALSMTGNIRLAEGDVEGSVEAYDEARRLLAEITATEDASYTRTRLATAYARAGDIPRARAELAAAREDAERSGSAFGLAVVDLVRADLAGQEGDRAEARRLAERALQRIEHVTGGPDQGRVMAYAALATLDAEDGEADRAWQRVRTAASLPGADLDMPVLSTLVLAAALVALRDGDPRLGARLLGAAYALRGTEERGAPEVIRLRRDLTAALGAEELDQLYAEGAALPRDQAIGLLSEAAR
ncbi:MAG TPA: hypothetical protein VF109_11010, partial [Mycobacteriales bacterium]